MTSIPHPSDPIALPSFPTRKRSRTDSLDPSPPPPPPSKIPHCSPPSFLADLESSLQSPSSDTDCSTSEELVAEMMQSLERVLEDPITNPTSSSLAEPEVRTPIQTLSDLSHILEASDDELGIPSASPPYDEFEEDWSLTDCRTSSPAQLATWELEMELEEQIAIEEYSRTAVYRDQIFLQYAAPLLQQGEGGGAGS